MKVYSQLIKISDKNKDYAVIAIFDRAWWAASLILISMHGVDMPFFDGRLNIAGWIILAGLRCIIRSLDSIHADNSKLVVDVG